MGVIPLNCSFRKVFVARSQSKRIRFEVGVENVVIDSWLVFIFRLSRYFRFKGKSVINQFDFTFWLSLIYSAKCCLTEKFADRMHQKHDENIRVYEIEENMTIREHSLTFFILFSNKTKTHFMYLDLNTFNVCGKVKLEKINVSQIVLPIGEEEEKRMTIITNRIRFLSFENLFMDTKPNTYLCLCEPHSNFESHPIIILFVRLEIRIMQTLTNCWLVFFFFQQKKTPKFRTVFVWFDSLGEHQSFGSRFVLDICFVPFTFSDDCCHDELSA